jgi:hypothetical protein
LVLEEPDPIPQFVYELVAANTFHVGGVLAVTLTVSLRVMLRYANEDRASWAFTMGDGVAEDALAYRLLTNAQDFRCVCYRYPFVIHGV